MNANKTLNTFTVVGTVRRLTVIASREEPALRRATLLVVFGEPNKPDNGERSENAVLIQVPVAEYERVAADLVQGCRVNIIGRLQERFLDDAQTTATLELEAERIAFLPETMSSEAPVLSKAEATPEDLAHTLRCLSQTVATLSRPQDTDTRFRSLESLAKVCVFGKGHLFSEEQQRVYAGILALMRHDGRHDGQPRPMTLEEQEECAALWVTLLTLAAERKGSCPTKPSASPSTPATQA
jgi:hypothetical protein